MLVAAAAAAIAAGSIATAQPKGVGKAEPGPRRTGTAVGTTKKIDPATTTITQAIDQTTLGTSAVTAPGPGLLGDTWDSGQQQCELSGKKILYRFWKQNNPLSWDPDAWTVYHSVGAEDKNSLGGGWSSAAKLVYIQYSFGYPTGTPVSGTKNVQNQWFDQGVLATGSGKGGFTSVNIRVVRSGGAHGVEANWPGNGCS
jgi:hypothetical protein